MKKLNPLISGLQALHKVFTYSIKVLKHGQSDGLEKQQPLLGQHMNVKQMFSFLHVWLGPVFNFMVSATQVLFHYILTIKCHSDIFTGKDDLL